MPVMPEGDTVDVSHGSDMNPVTMELTPDSASQHPHTSEDYNYDEQGNQQPVAKDEPKHPDATPQQPAQPEQAAVDYKAKYEEQQKLFDYLNTPQGIAWFAQRYGLTQAQAQQQVAQGQQAQPQFDPAAFKFKFNPEDINEIDPQTGQSIPSPEKFILSAFKQAIESGYLNHHISQMLGPQLTPMQQFVEQQRQAEERRNVEENNKAIKTWVDSHREADPSIDKFVTPGTPEFNKMIELQNKFPAMSLEERYVLINSTSPARQEEQRAKIVKEKVAGSIHPGGNPAPTAKKEPAKFNDIKDLVKQEIRRQGQITSTGL